MPTDLIDVKQLLRRYTLEELNAAADNYFKHVDQAGILRKPFHELGEAPEVALTFTHVLKVLAQPRGATILDFGCGTAWSSAIMAGLGYDVIASDVSSHALEIGRKGYPDQRIRFLLFDGRHIDLPDASVDAVTCLSALHHVPNVHVVLSEIARVLKPWGVAGFSEPGPHHSLSPQSQSEMRQFTVIENDIDIDDIWRIASGVGFTSIELGLFQPEPILASLDGFKHYLGGGSVPMFDTAMRALMAERRLFFLEKGLPGVTTSLAPGGLDAKLQTSGLQEGQAGGRLTVRVTAANTGSALWRPSMWSAGPVRLGPTLIAPGGAEVTVHRCLLPTTRRHGVLPGQEVTVDLELPLPAEPGPYKLRLQMVSELVAWFGEIYETPIIVR